MMEENNKGKGFGIFYAVVGVATLVVAIIGATFAFFAASEKADITKGTTASAGGLTLTATKITETDSTLIPVNFIVNQTSGKDTVDQFADAVNAAKGGVCKDSNGNNVCVIYRIDVANKSSTSNIDVRGTLTLTSSAKNVYWKLINVTEKPENKVETATKVDYSKDVVATSAGGKEFITVGGNSGASVEGLEAQKKEASKTLGFSPENNSAKYYVIIWLEETGAEQQDDDASKNFSGTVDFSAVDKNGNSSGITASFAA